LAAGRLRAVVFLRAVAFLRVAGRFRAAVFFRAVVFLRAVDFRAVVFLRAVDFRAVVFLRAVDLFAVDRFFVAFLAPEDAFLAGLTMPPFVNALRVAPAYEGPVFFDDAFRAGAAGLQSLRSCSGTPRMRSSLRPCCRPRICAGCTTSCIAVSATLSSNSNVFNGATNSQVMKKYLTIRQEPSLAVKHFRCTARLRVARAYVGWTRKPFVCKDFLHVACR